MELTSEQLRSARQHLRDQNRRFPKDGLAQVPESMWPSDIGHPRPVRVWRGREFLVQEHAPVHGVVRLSVNRTMLDRHGGWKQGITWDDLQRIKDMLGYEDYDAVEVYPRARDVVNVANIRHVWVLLKELLPFAWRDVPKSARESSS